MELSQQTCEACRADSPRVSDEEVTEYHRQVPNWELRREKGVDQLRREFSFHNFRQALNFTREVGELAEEFGHHPAIVTEWGRVTVAWWTHKINGLHRNDFIMAAKTDSLFEKVRPV